MMPGRLALSSALNFNSSGHLVGSSIVLRSSWVPVSISPKLMSVHGRITQSSLCTSQKTQLLCIPVSLNTHISWLTNSVNSFWPVSLNSPFTFFSSLPLPYFRFSSSHAKSIELATYPDFSSYYSFSILQLHCSFLKTKQNKTTVTCFKVFRDLPLSRKSKLLKIAFKLSNLLVQLPPGHSALLSFIPHFAFLADFCLPGMPVHCPTLVLAHAVPWICSFPDGNAISFEKTQLDSLPPNPKFYLLNFGSPSFWSP